MRLLHYFPSLSPSPPKPELTSAIRFATVDSSLSNCLWTHLPKYSLYMHAGSDRPRRRTVLCTVRVHGRKCGFWERFLAADLSPLLQWCCKRMLVTPPYFFTFPPSAWTKTPVNFHWPSPSATPPKRPPENPRAPRPTQIEQDCHPRPSVF